MKRLFARLLLAGWTVLLCLSLLACGEKTAYATRDLIWAIGTVLPEAEEFVVNLREGDRVEFASADPYRGLRTGDNEVELILHPAKGRRQTLRAKLTLIRDEEGPRILGVRELVAYVGEGVAYRAGLSLEDNCGGAITLEVDSSAVDTSKEGVYPVFYWAQDVAGNVTFAETVVHVYAERITEEMLHAQIDPLIAQLGLSGMSREEQVRAIWRFVHTDARITYVDTSDKADWMREAYFTLLNRKGDCFSYFALSKAFFTRLGIENLDVQRLPGYTDDTHYWSMVNIGGSGAAARWYHYDATRLRDVSQSGALLTDAQVDAFSLQRPYFYYYDRGSYPPTSTVILTERSDLQ